MDFGLELDNLISIETSKIFREEIGDNDDVMLTTSIELEHF